jgi:hypothetical protein
MNPIINPNPVSTHVIRDNINPASLGARAALSSSTNSLHIDIIDSSKLQRTRIKYPFFARDMVASLIGIITYTSQNVYEGTSLE